MEQQVCLVVSPPAPRLLSSEIRMIIQFFLIFNVYNIEKRFHIFCVFHNGSTAQFSCQDINFITGRRLIHRLISSLDSLRVSFLKALIAYDQQLNTESNFR